MKTLLKACNSKEIFCPNHVPFEYFLEGVNNVYTFPNNKGQKIRVYPNKFSLDLDRKIRENIWHPIDSLVWVNLMRTMRRKVEEKL